GECIRATALGASEYSVQLSGNTSYISKPGELLPRRNLQVLQPSYVCEESIDADKLAKAIRAHFTAFDLIEGEGEVALALRWRGAPSYERMLAFAEGIRHGLATTIERRKPLYIMLDGDVAQTLGAILREELLIESEILAIDGLVLRDFDYIDLGRIRMPSFTVPVTIKSLLFSEDPRRGRPHQRIHHHDHGGHGHHHHHDHDWSPIRTRIRVLPVTGAVGRLAPSPAVATRLDAGWVVIGVPVALVVWLALVPLVFLLWQSFLTPQTATLPAHYTLENFRTAYLSSDNARLFFNSLQFAAGAAVLSLVVGTGLAWMNERTNTPFKTLFFALAIIPLVIPGILFTVSWIMLASPKIGLVNLALQKLFDTDAVFVNVYTMAGMIWVDGLHYSPMAFLLMTAAFRSMDPALEEQAAVSGASVPQIARRITLRLAWPAALGSLLILFVRSI